MAEVLYSGLVAPADVSQMVASCRFTSEALFMAELLPTHFVGKPQEREQLLCFTFFNTTLRCTDYTSGRIFQADRELRWEKQGEQTRFVYLGQADNASELARYQLKKAETFGELTRKLEPTYYYLFGERLQDRDLAKLGKAAQKGDFAVVRIPRTLRYPVKVNSDRYARLAVCEYLEEANGRVVLYRFQGIEAVKGER